MPKNKSTEEISVVTKFREKAEGLAVSLGAGCDDKTFLGELRSIYVSEEAISALKNDGQQIEVPDDILASVRESKVSFLFGSQFERNKALEGCMIGVFDSVMKPILRKNSALDPSSIDEALRKSKTIITNLRGIAQAYREAVNLAYAQGEGPFCVGPGIDGGSDDLE